jgi:HrpA-like RNA helicase
MIAKVANDALRLDQKKPLQTTHHFIQSYDANNNQVQLNSSTYKNRIHRDKVSRLPIQQFFFYNLASQTLIMEVSGQGGSYSKLGVMGAVKGRSGNVYTDRHLDGKVITSVTSIGRDDPTTAEAQRAATVLRILQGSEKLLDESPWIRNIWFPADNDGPLIWPKEWSEKSKSESSLKLPDRADPKTAPSKSTVPLNSSQQDAVNTMFSTNDDHRITLIQGPPGTGKTSVIAAFVLYALRYNKGGIWLIAQSNVAVKNIAEKLMSVGFENWRLLVSQDFHDGW